jgi:SAM-dependent methyltransferase
VYNKLNEYLKRPALYERTTEQFWNDPYIATQMLKAHLDPKTDAASRKPDFIHHCAEWVASLLPKSANLLDIGCGPGLYTKQFAKHGLRVTGLDFSKNSIAYAREHDPNSKYIVQDYLSMNFESVFDMVTLIYYDYGALIPEERHELLCRITKALKPNGFFLLDVMTPLKSKNKRDCTSWSVNPNGGFWSAKPHVCLNADYYYSETAEGSRTVVIEEDTIHCYNLWDCYFTKQSLLDEVMPHGFAEHSFYNDATGKPYTDDSETMCAILKKGEK